MGMTTKRLNELLRDNRGNRSGFITKVKAEDPGTSDSDAGNLYDKANPTNSNSNSNSSQQGSITNVNDVINAGSGTSKISEMSSLFKTKITSEKDFGDPNKVQELILQQLQKESNLRTEINEAMGLTGELSRSFRESLIETTPAAALLGYDIGNITDMMTTLSESTGKFNLISTNTLKQSFDTARAFGMQLPQLSAAFGEFEKVGLGAADTLVKINTAGLASASLGLNSKKTTQDLKTNIEKLNEYGFKNGVEGLNRMVQKSAEFRMNMAETFKVAEKVMNPESAIELTANMQMLGGAIGDLNDPLKLMYMATNNVEGLQDAIQGAAGTLAVFNSEQGRFEITGANLRRGKEMAATLGISYSEFAKGAIAAQERLMATDTLLAKGFNLDDKDREFITNLSQMKDGQMQIVIPKSLSESVRKSLGIGSENEIKLSELTDAQIKALKENKEQLEGKTAAQMADEMLSETKKMSNSLESMALSLGITGKKQAFGKEGELLDGKEKVIPLISEMLKTLSEFRMGANAIADDPGKISGLLKEPFDLIKKGSELLGTEFDVLKEQLKVFSDALIDANKTNKTVEQQKIEMENLRRNERSMPKNNETAFQFNTNLKVTHIGLGNNMTIDETGKGYLTPMQPINYMS